MTNHPIPPATEEDLRLDLKECYERGQYLFENNKNFQSALRLAAHYKREAAENRELRDALKEWRGAYRARSPRMMKEVYERRAALGTS